LKTLNAVVIGCGVVGLRRIKHFGKRFSLVACADKNIHKITKIFGNKKIFKTSNWRDLLKLDNIDAVFIATFHSIQAEIIKEFIKKDTHIFCEKPGGVSLKQTKQLIKLLKNKKKLSIKIGFNHRFHPAFILAKKIISKNQIGNLLYVRAIYGHGGRKNYAKEWRFNKKFSGGGEMIDKGSHLIDLSRMFLGNLKTHSSYLNNYYWQSYLEDNCFLILKNKENKIAFLHASSTEWKNKFIFEIFGKKGKIEINGLGKSYGIETLTLYQMLKSMGIPKKKEYKFTQKSVDNSWIIEIEDFYKSILNLKKCYPNLNDVYDNLKIISEVYQK